MNSRENLIGIMADSHGKPGVIEKALDLLKGMGCSTIFHLGDICDSMTPETADACVELLEESNVLAVKGNNDHAVVVNHKGMNLGVVSESTLDYLEGLPMARKCRDADLAHSMPFVREMGLSAMIGSMGELQASYYFGRKPKALLFRGHSHDPAIAEAPDGKYEESLLKPGKPVSLADRKPCIITCGALTRGYATIWDFSSNKIECLTFIR